MLSASSADASPAPVEFHIVAIIVSREPQPTITAVYSAPATTFYDNAPWGNHFAPRPDVGPKGPIGLHGGGFYSHFDPYHPPAPLLGSPTPPNDPATGVVGTGVPKGALAAGAPTNDATIGGVRNGNQNHAIVEIGMSRPLPPPGVVDTFANYYSSLSANVPAGSSITLPVARSAKAQEAVFESYSSDSLLLATDLDSVDDDRIDRALDDELAAGKMDATDARLARQSMFDEATDVALDALQRERHAIEAVLSELHEVKLSTHEDTSAAPQSADERNSSPDRERERDPIWNGDAAATARRASVADGGMVILEPSGDANSSAYDLTSVYLSELQIADTQPPGVEASLGMYQAIDVGTSDPPAAVREQLPMAQPAQAVRPSVSAENAPAKKSEQPT